MASLEEMVGQMMMVGLDGEELSSEEKHLLHAYPFGGFVLFDRNLTEPAQIHRLCRSLWEIRKEHSPFIAIDHEGGRVHRLPAPFTHFPAAALLGRANDPELAYEVGLAMGRELSGVGINLNFAPVLDVRSNPDNPVIGDRSLSADSRQVAALGWAIVEGLREGGIIPCVKHFPGHGDTAQDSHLELPVVEKSMRLLKEVELLPFIHASKNQVESLMTAHVLYPALDPTFPATLSRTIVGRLLRQELGYQGVVFADDLAMGAISKNYPPEEAVSRAVSSGVDVLLWCHDKESAVRASDFLYQRAEKSAQTKAGIEDSYQRINRLKQRYLRSFKGVGEALLTKHIGITNHHKLAEKIIRAGEH